MAERRQREEAQPGEGGRERLFFALWPAAAVRRRLHQAARDVCRGLPGRRMPADNLHITLAFLGHLDDAGRACVERAAQAAAGDPFELALDRAGWWARRRVVWLGASETPPALLELVRSLNRQLLDCGHTPERRPFQPHVTLMRKALRPPPVREIPPLRWPVDGFALVRSRVGREGARYEPVGHWPLRGG